MTDLAAAANQIESQLDLANSLSGAISGYAANGQIVSDGTIDPALINQQMVNAYNDAIDAVLNTSYVTVTASDVLYSAGQTALGNMSLAIDNLVQATAVLATVSAVADMAASANTAQEQLQVQVALSNTDMTISAADVGAYNNALGAVESYAQQAGAFLSAASNNNITSAIDSYAAANGVAVSNYTAISYTQSMDQFVIEFGSSAYLQFNGAFSGSTKSAEDVWGQIGYIGG